MINKRLNRTICPTTIGKAPRRIITVAFYLLLLVSIQAQTTTLTDPKGYCNLGAYANGGTYQGLLSNSDTLISIPFTRTPEFVGAIQSVTENVVTLVGTPGWTNNQFVYSAGTQPKTYFALIGPGASGVVNPKEGCIYTVTANSTNTLTLFLNGDIISPIPANAQITLIPYWTLATVFPPANAGVSFTASPSPISHQTQILIPNTSAVGINLPCPKTYYFISSGTNIGWRVFGEAATVDHGDDILPLDSYFVVRNPSGASTLPLVAIGNVLTGKLTIPLATTTATSVSNPSASQDNLIVLMRPVDVTLNKTGLNPQDGSFVASPSVLSRMDQLLVYDNSQAKINKSPKFTYYYMNGAWRLFGNSPTEDHGNDVIPAGTAFVIRKASTGTGETAFWTNSPNY